MMSDAMRIDSSGGAKELCIRGGELQALRLSAKESEGLKYKAFLFGKTEDISGDICLKPIL